MKPLPLHPSFCIIAPTAYLPQYATRSRVHLVLAHLVDSDPVYAEFYRTLSTQGDYIIMDNGAFELGASYDPHRLISLGARCGADALVLPDYPFEHCSKTIDAAKEWTPLFKTAGFRTFFVPQSEVGDIDGWIRAYEWAGGNPDIDMIGMSILGIPNALPHIPAAYARVVMSQLLVDRRIMADKYHHFLGLNAGPALEIPPLIKMAILGSCDSSGPVWAGILGHEYSRNTDSYLATSKVKAHVEFDYPMTKDSATHRRIMHNIDLTLELFK
jgi:hypothetical protein